MGRKPTVRAALGSSGRLGMKEVVVTCLGTNNRTSCMKERNDRGSWKAKESDLAGKRKNTREEQKGSCPQGLLIAWTWRIGPMPSLGEACFGPLM